MHEPENGRELHGIETIQTIQGFIQIKKFFTNSRVSVLGIYYVRQKIQKHGLLIGVQMIKVRFSFFGKIAAVDLGNAKFEFFQGGTGTIFQIIYFYRPAIWKIIIQLVGDILGKIRLAEGDNHGYV